MGKHRGQTIVGSSCHRTASNPAGYLDTAEELELIDRFWTTTARAAPTQWETGRRTKNSPVGDTGPTWDDHPQTAIS